MGAMSMSRARAVQPVVSAVRRHCGPHGHVLDAAHAAVLCASPQSCDWFQVVGLRGCR